MSNEVAGESRSGTADRTPEIRSTEPIQNNEPVAIVGIGCRFPGADSPEEFWSLLRNGVDAIGELPGDRFDVEGLYDARMGIPGKLYCKKGGFIDGVDMFDASFFGISPREASRIDPQQRIMLEVAWEALEDAGQPVDELADSRTGVFLGVCVSDYEDLMFADASKIDVYSAVGGFRCAVPGRISYALGLQGPSISLDAGCASSLVAVHLAVQSIRSGECDLALAGGVNLILHPQISIAFAKSGMLSPDGCCKPFDADADGFVRSEGAALVVLKPLSKALRDGDPIYATVLGSAVNDDGRGNGLFFSPSLEGHRAVLKDAYRNAGVLPSRAQYVETHGTGTKVGDPTEAQALGTFFRDERPDENPLRIGSVKSNIGHTESAAGIAGLIKVALSLKHREIPGTVHLKHPNPAIPWQELKLRAQSELEPWPLAEESSAIAGVSSLGISGTNAHVVLGEAPQTVTQGEAEAPFNDQHLLALSARSPETLRTIARSYVDLLDGLKSSERQLYDVCYTAAVRRSHHKYKLAVVGSSAQEQSESLEAFLQGENRPGLAFADQPFSGRRKIGFIFSGHGAQWVGMGRQLVDASPIFREALRKCDAAIRKHAGWSVLEELNAADDQPGANQTARLQPILFSLQVGLAELWRAWGIEPAAVMGHSMGEVAAACVAGAISLDDAARIICLRSDLLTRLSGKGRMALIELSLAEAEGAVAGYEDQVSVAVSNSPAATVIAGETGAMNELVESLERQGVSCRWIKADGAGHSPQVDPLAAELASQLRDLQPMAASTTIYSSVTGTVIDGVDLDSSYWAANIRNKVLFSKAVERMMEDGVDLFIEISAHPILQTSIKQVSALAKRDCVVLPSMRRDEDENGVLKSSLGMLYVLGQFDKWQNVYPSGGRCVTLPAYPWQRERYWVEENRSDQDQFASILNSRRANEHPLLGRHLQSSIHHGSYFWETQFSTAKYAYLSDHRINDRSLLPATAYMEMALAAGQRLLDGRSCQLRDLELKTAVFLPEQGVVRVQLVASAAGPGRFSLRFFSQAEADENDRWTLNATATLVAGDSAFVDSSTPFSLEEIENRCNETRSGSEFYAWLSEQNMDYGPSFRGVGRVWRRDGEALARVDTPEAIAGQERSYLIHPSVMDSCLQVVMSALKETEGEARRGYGYMPIGVRLFQVSEKPGLSIWSHTLLDAGAEDYPEMLECDVSLLDEEGRVLARVEGLQLQRILPADNEAEIDDWIYDICWEPCPSGEREHGAHQGSWLIFADQSGIGHQIATLLGEKGETCTLVRNKLTQSPDEPSIAAVDPSRPEDFRQILNEVYGKTRALCRGVLYLWSLDSPDVEELTLEKVEAAQELTCIGGLHLVQALAEVGWDVTPRLFLVTRGAQPIHLGGREVDILQSGTLGLGRAVAQEHRELRCKRIDLSPLLCVESDLSEFVEELFIDDDEEEVALRDSMRFVPRLKQYTDERPRDADSSSKIEAYVVEPETPLQLELRRPAMLENLVYHRAVRMNPGPGEVEIAVVATGLNFRDVATAIGLLSQESDNYGLMGFECSGRVVAVGEGVTDYRVGDEAIAVSFSGFRNFLTVDARLVVPKPPEMSFEAAASIPGAYLTAYYAVCELGRIKPGERVLIHAAAGGFGLAALQLAKDRGAEILATAGSPEKRAYLKSLGVKHVMDSRSLDFVTETRRITNGEGVDVVLNSLAGEFIGAGFSLLRSQGRFIEIGQVDISQGTPLDMKLFQGNKSFFAADLHSLLESDPQSCSRMMSAILAKIATGNIELLPLRVFPAPDVVDAFHHMAQARHIGKIVISWPGHQIPVERTEAESLFHSDGSYLITGGLGGLGLTTARWMAQNGARHIALTGRRGADASVEEALRDIEAFGAEVAVIKADVSDRAQVRGLVEQIQATMPPLKGIIHAAAVLDDGVLLQLNAARFKTVLAAKTLGTWNLHSLTADAELDFFVFFSSITSLLGTPGQANYVSGNAFLDAFSHYRRSKGFPSVAINWGVWSDVGGVANSDRLESIEQRGIQPISARRGMNLLGKIMRQDKAQLAAARFDTAGWLSKFVDGRPNPLFKHLASAEKVNEGSRDEEQIRKLLLAEEDGQARWNAFETFVKREVARVLRTSASRIDSGLPLNRQGLDSLMSIELRNRLESQIGHSLSSTMIWKYPSITALLPYLAEKMNVPLSVDPDFGQGSSALEDDNIIAVQLEQLSQSTLGLALAARLEALDEL